MIELNEKEEDYLPNLKDLIEDKNKNNLLLNLIGHCVNSPDKKSNAFVPFLMLIVNDLNK